MHRAYAVITRCKAWRRMHPGMYNSILCGIRIIHRVVGRPSRPCLCTSIHSDLAKWE